MPERLHPDIVHRNNVVNQSSRDGVKPRLIVVHSTEGRNIKGIGDLVGLGSWFDNPTADASSHVGVDAEGQSARYVDDERKAWTCAGFNPISLNIEMIGFASQGSWTDAELKEAARWCAKWSIKFDIPAQIGDVAGSRVVKAGIVRHSDLGVFGGGHHDPGAGFRMLELVNTTKEIKRALNEGR
jgi:N-acetyl-anhydromuramyl-L-alanine amidase AmpD